MYSKILLANLLSLAAAQKASTTISMPWIGADYRNGTVLESISASIISANPTATTVSLACAAPTVDCGVFPAEIHVFGPSTYNVNMGDPSPGADFTATMDCDIAKTAVCKESASGTEANFPGSSTETYEAEDVATYGVVVTAGMEKLNFKVEASTTVESAGKASAMSTSASGSAGSMSSAKLPASTGVSATGSATTPAATGAAAVNAVGGGLLSLAAGVLGGLLL